ncbi:unnamed protein product, partial [Rotaria magnacalcarata]
MIVSILGVWKSGAAYVPIDPAYPDERIEFIMQDAKAKIVMANKKYMKRFLSYEVIKIDIDSITAVVNSHKKINMPPMCSSTNLAYIIYTSGTTGKPKSVLVEHGSVVSFTNAVICRYFGKDNSETLPQAILLVSNYVFDMSIEQLALSILNSNKLIIISNEFTIDETFYAYLNENQLTYMSLTPNQLQQMDIRKLKYLQVITVAGEPLTEIVFKKIRKQYAGKLINAYGITETTVYNVVYIYENEMKYNNSMGFPLSNTKGFVLNKSMQMLPMRAVGELYLTGDCVTRGYLNRPEMTAERFLPNPFQTDEEKKQGKNGRLYKTGDLVRWRFDGELEYLCRNDLQVKIRGLRIELGEIEAVLSSYQGVKQSVVIATDAKTVDGEERIRKYLVGYYVSDNEIYESDLKEYMETKLPDYMIPNRLMQLEKIPVTISGKLDVKALPDIDFSVGENNYCAPRNELEAKLCAIWSDLLVVEKVGITDDFFRLGGDSIGSLQVVSRVRQDIGLCISVKDVFAFKTIEKLYDNKLKVEIFHLNDSGEILNATELGNSSKEYPLLPIQEYLLKGKCLSNNYFNQCVMIRIAGFDENRFKDCLAKLVAHHDVFRIRFKKDAEGKYCSSYQMNLNSNEINLVRVATSPSTDMTLETKWRDYFRKTIDIENGPMYMVGYSYDHGDNNSARVWIFVHDLIVDWISCRIISEDLQRLYAGNDLSSNSCYKQWSIAVNGYVSSIGKNEVMYWEKLLSANVNIFNGVLVDKQQTDNDTCETEIILTAEMIKILFNDCNKIYNTQVEHLLLTGLSYTLRDEITNLNENYVMFECSGRNFVNNLDMGQSVGMFKIIYPVLLQLADDDMRTSIVNVKEHVQQVPNKGIGFGAIIGNENNQVPWISFNYLGLFENEDSEDGNKDAWHLLDAFCENTMDENTKELIKINAFIINKEMRLNIKTKMGIKRTVRFGKAFQFHIENIIKHAQLINRSYLTRSDVNYVIKDDDYLNRIQSEKEVNAIFMANSLQQGLLYHALKQSNVDDAYIVQFVFQYRTAIDQKLFKLAWEHAQKRFSCLRLRFDWQEELIQIIDKNQPLNWSFIDLTAEQDISNQESKIKQIQEEDRNERFKLDVGNLFRVYLIQQNSDLFALIFTFHHIILDGWSLPILFDYVHQDYLNLIDDEHSPTPISSSNSSSVHDESYENAQIYLQEHSQENIDYWENEINKIEERCDFTGLLKQESKNKVVLNQYDHVKQQKESKLLIGDNLYRNLKKSCRNNGLTLSSMLQFAWHKVLNVYGNSNQTVTGTTVSGRDLPIDNIETSVGLFINTLPLIVNHTVDNSIIDAIKNIQDKMNEMINRSNVDFSQLTKGKLKHDLFDCLFAYGNYPTMKRKVERGGRFIDFEEKYTVEKFDYPLVVMAYEAVEKECVTFVVNYAGELFENGTIDDLLAVTNELLIKISDEEVARISDLHFLPKKQLNMIDEWNNTARDFPELNTQTTIHKLFEEEAEKSSVKVAVVYEDVQLTYRELNEKANQLAHYLRSICDIHPDDLVALCLDKSELMIVSILGVWKSGAAYVPIDPTYPDERIEFIMQDTKAKIVIVNKKHMKRFLSYDMIKIDVDSLSATVNGHKKDNMLPMCSRTNLAYVIYTSGTTGKPKGVMIEHSGVINLKAALTDLFLLRTRAESILSFSNYVFDHFVEQLTYALLNSQVLVILNDEMRVDKPRLYQYLNKNKVTYLSGTPSVLQEYDFEQLRYIIRIDAVGEDFSEITFNKIRSKFNGLIINGYGPTEISITSHKRLYYLGEKRINKSIGRQIANTSCYVLDKNFNQIPVGGIGELYIGGIGVARGYLNRRELTAERFLPNPFQTDEEKKQGKNARLYKTGDLVRWLLNGEIEYLGRNDLQVKIRGLRIELGEIEAVLSSYQGVKQSVVIATDAKTVDGEERIRKYLVGYYVSDYEIDESDVKLYMETKLPDYMIPNRLMRLEKIPVNISGKLDLRALPQVDFSKYNKNELVLPRNSLEARIIQIWSDLLHIPVENISIHDDFFRLGGDSILVIRLLLMLTKLLAVKLTVASLFDNKTIAKLASHIFNGDDYTPEQNDHLSTMNTDHSNHPYYLLSFAQERLLFISEFEGADGTNAYNIPMYIEFSNNNVQRDLLYQSLLAILYRHEILRTLIHEDQLGVTSQHVLNEAEVHSLFKINEISVVNKEQLDAELIKLAKYVFNLRKELLIKVTFYEMKNEDGYDCTTLYMGILMHHICFDGWSQNIFWKELQIFYDYFKKQVNNYSVDSSSYLTLNLPALPVQYKDFATWQRKYLSGERLHNLSKFWKSKLDGFEMLNLISDCQIRPSIYDYSGDEIKFELNEQTTTGLKQLAKNLNVSLFSLLLSAYTFMLSNYTNQQDIVIGTPAVNRNQPELEHLIGFFVNMLVLRIKIDPHDNTMDYITKVSNEVIEAQIHQDMPFDCLVKEMQIETDVSRHPIVQVVFLMDNQFQIKPSITYQSTESGKSTEISQYSPNQQDFYTAKYDITTSITESDIRLKGYFNFATKIFQPSTINGFIRSFVNILRRFSQLKQSSKLSDIDCIDTAQKDQIEKWNQMDRHFTELATHTTLHKVFEEEVEKSSEKIAIVYEDVQLTYRELNEKANRLAHYLRSICDIQPDDLIALFLDKSELMIVSIMGVWKSGAAYVPIDPTYPEERVQFILEDTNARIVITNKKYMTRFDRYDIIKIEVDCSLANQLINKHSMTFNPDPNTTKDNLAYVIYTSGTTGQPKGVMVEHGTVVAFRNDVIQRYFGADHSENLPKGILFLANYCFDMSIEQIVLSILASKMLIIISNTFTTDENFYAYLNAKRMAYMSMTPSQLQGIDLTNFKYLESLTLGGEHLSEVVFDKVRTQFSGKVRNVYGLTETTICNVFYLYENDTHYKNSMGVPLSNTKRFILNKSLQMLPVHAVGELYLSGNCVSRGYLNRPELTAERFLPNPFQTDEEKKERKNARIYKTGDLVRWLPDGELEYLGRNDLQVKIRGLRIELGEIETILSSYQGVKRSVVLAKDHKKKNIDAPSTKYLVGYYVSDDDINESDIKQYMQTKLPDYMIPNRLMRIEKIPVTINGKLDTKGLPEFHFSVEENNYCAPRNELEASLCEIWSDILGIEKVGITDNFFQLGGDSIGSLQIVGRLRQDNDLNISVKDIFMFKTIEKLYDNKLKDQVMHSNADVESLNGIELRSSTGEIGLLWIQEIALFDENKFKDCLVKLVPHHEAFGIRFKKDADGKYFPCYQTNLDSDQINLVRIKTLSSTEMTLET